MMTILFLFLIAAVLRKALLNMTKEYEKDIASTNDYSEIIDIREKAKRTRFIFLSCYSVFLILFLFHKYKSLISEIPILVVLLVVLYVLLVWMLMKKNDFKGVTLRVSTMELQNIPNKYILYLRGFEQDVYFSDVILEEDRYKCFSEYKLSEYFDHNIPFIAIGMTKEIWQPRGAMRLYVGDESWQEAVGLLMKQSLCNVILVNDRDSCIWEIEQSYAVLDKTVFIVDDIEKYNHVKAKVKKVNMPNIEAERMLHGFFFIIKDYGAEIEQFNPAQKSDYRKLGKFIAKKFCVKNQVINTKVVFYLMGIAISLLINVLGIIQLSSEYDNKVLGVIIISLLSLYYFTKFLINYIKR